MYSHTKHNKTAAIIALAVGVFAAPAFAQDSGQSTFPTPREVTNVEEMKPSIGLRLGAADPTDGYDATTEYGLEFGIQPYIPYGVGAVVSMYSAERDGQPDLDRTKVLARGTYNFGGTIPVIRSSFVGADAGLVVDTLGRTSYGRFGVGPVAGFDIPLSAKGLIDRGVVTLGANVSYLLVSDAAADDFGLRGQLKYWF